MKHQLEKKMWWKLNRNTAYGAPQPLPSLHQVFGLGENTNYEEVEVVEVKPLAVCRKRWAMPPSGLFQVSEPVLGHALHEEARLWLREVSVELGGDCHPARMYCGRLNA